jgi:histone H3/H4
MGRRNQVDAPKSEKLAEKIQKAAEKPRRKRRAKSGAKALREIKKYQSSTEPLLLRAPFRRLVRELTGVYTTTPRYTRSALATLQMAAEDHLVDLLRKSHASTLANGRRQLAVGDVRLLRELMPERFGLPEPQ